MGFSGGHRADLWPDALVIGDEEPVGNARGALGKFLAYAAEKQERWWRNVLAKTSCWAFAGRPAEAYKFTGPLF